MSGPALFASSRSSRYIWDHLNYLKETGVDNVGEGMEFLFSGIPPVGDMKTLSWKGTKKYNETWLENAGKSDSIRVCTGYFSASAVTLLAGIAKNSPKLLKVEFCVGMAKSDGLQATQLRALENLNDVLLSEKKGGVFIVDKFKFHGKISTFSMRGQQHSAILGSSNFSNLEKHEIELYECDVGIYDKTKLDQLSSFSDQIIQKASRPFSEVEISVNQPKSTALDDYMAGESRVQKISDYELNQIKEKASLPEAFKCKLPVFNPEQKMSSLNVYFGKGRENSQKTLVIPRPWYEVEIIPGRHWFNQHPLFPQQREKDDPEGIITVVTDDGYKFEIYGSYDKSYGGSKNIRSTIDLQILGRWIKGKLEVSGTLSPGKPVTDDVLTKYGNKEISLIRVNEGNVWYMTFLQATGK